MITDKRAGHHESNPIRVEREYPTCQGGRGNFVARTFKKIDSGDTYATMCHLMTRRKQADRERDTIYPGLGFINFISRT